MNVSHISSAMTNLIYRCHYLPKGQVHLPPHLPVSMKVNGRPCYPSSGSEQGLGLLSLIRMICIGFHWHVQYVLARIFGTGGVLFDREEEQQIFAAVAHAGLGPRLLVRHLS